MRPATNNRDCSSRDEFIQRLRRLGASLGMTFRRESAQNGTVEEVQPLFLSCPRDDWIKAFGEPHQIRTRRDSETGKSVQMWEYVCYEGPIQFVCHPFALSSGSEWVVMQQLLRFIPYLARRTVG